MVVEIILIMLVAYALVFGKTFGFTLTIRHEYPEVEKADIQKMMSEMTKEEESFYEESKSVLGALNELMTGEYNEKDRTS